MTKSRTSITVQELVRAVNAHQLIEELTSGEFVPLDAPNSPPWFAQGVITQVHAQQWRFFVAFHDTTTITNDAGRQYFVVEDPDGTFEPRLFWQRDEFYLACELSTTQAELISSL